MTSWFVIFQTIYWLSASPVQFLGPMSLEACQHVVDDLKRNDYAVHAACTSVTTTTPAQAAPAQAPAK